MNKKPDIYLKEYCQQLTDDNIKFLAQRLNQKLSGDIAEVFDFLSESKEVDRWLASANSVSELYEMIDFLSPFVQKEYDRRNVS